MLINLFQNLAVNPAAVFRTNTSFCVMLLLQLCPVNLHFSVVLPTLYVCF